MAKALIKLPLLSRNVSKLSKCVATSRLCHVQYPPAERSRGVQDKELSSKEIFELLQKDYNPVNLVANIEVHKKQVNSRHVVTALKFMQEYYKANGISPSSIHNSAPFVSICSLLNKHLRGFDLNQSIQVLKILNYFQVPSSKVIVQNVLQMIRYAINDLTLEQIYFLSFLFKNMEPTPLSDAISAALPPVFMSQLNLKLDTSSLKELKNALRFASENAVDGKTLETILKAFNVIQEDVDVHSAASIMQALSNIDKRNIPIDKDNYLNILQRMQNIIFEDTEQLKQHEALKILKILLLKTYNGAEEYYEPFLIDKIISQLIATECSFNNGIDILQKLNNLDHINLQLLSYLCMIGCQDSWFLSKPYSASILVKGLANANFKPSNWEQMKNLILNYYGQIQNEATICHLALRLVSLDCVDFKLLSRVFTSDQNPKFLSENYHQAFKQLYINIRTLYPNYNGPWPSEELLQSFAQKSNRSKRYPLLSALELLLKNPSFIKTNVQTTDGYDIDHLVILQDNNPIALDSSADCKYLEDMDIPPNSERVAILLLPEEAYGRNIQRLKAPVLLNIKALEKIVDRVVCISSNLWLNLPEWEKLPYLRNEIGLKEQDSIEARN